MAISNTSIASSNSTSSISSSTTSSSRTSVVQRTAFVALCALSCLCALACEFALVSNFLDPSWITSLTHLSSSTLLEIAAPVAGLSLAILGAGIIHKAVKSSDIENSPDVETPFANPTLNPDDQEVLNILLSLKKETPLHYLINKSELSKPELNKTKIAQDYPRGHAYYINNKLFIGTSEDFIKTVENTLSSLRPDLGANQINQVLNSLHQGTLTILNNSMNSKYKLNAADHDFSKNPKTFHLITENNQIKVELGMPTTLLDVDRGHKKVCHAQLHATIYPLQGKGKAHFTNLEMSLTEKKESINLQELHEKSSALLTSDQVTQQAGRDLIGSAMFIGLRRIHSIKEKEEDDTKNAQAPQEAIAEEDDTKNAQAPQEAIAEEIKKQDLKPLNKKEHNYTQNGQALREAIAEEIKKQDLNPLSEEAMNRVLRYGTQGALSFPLHFCREKGTIKGRGLMADGGEISTSPFASDHSRTVIFNVLEKPNNVLGNTNKEAQIQISQQFSQKVHAQNDPSNILYRIIVRMDISDHTEDSGKISVTTDNLTSSDNWIEALETDNATPATPNGLTSSDEDAS